MPDFLTMFLDKDNLFKIGLTAAALAISAFVLWGPRLSSRRRYKGLVGLENLGLTCFVNSLLQAFASCPVFVEWLQKIKGNGPVSDSLATILNLLAYERDCGGDWEIESPGELLLALSRHGWSIAPQEQDTHEMLLLLLTTLEEEHAKTNKSFKGSLEDALEVNGREDIKESHEVDCHGDIPNISRPHRCLMSNGRDEVSSMSKTLSSPFRGYLTSQLQCLSCGHKSSIQYDKFDTLSLHLPPGVGRTRLVDLLGSLVKKEVLDFSCDSCPGEKPSPSKAIKTVNIGKLPKCLCLHISRTYITPEGEVYKKENYVDFPEFLSMTRFTREGKQTEEETESSVLVNGDQGVLHPPPSNHEGNNNNHSSSLLIKPLETEVRNGNVIINGISQVSSKHLYRLKAVVEHKGSVENGHFVTYRRGPLASNLRHRSCPNRWYYTSDSEVRSSTMCDALLSNAYLIFYEKCSL